MFHVKCLIIDFGNVIARFDHRDSCKQLARLSPSKQAPEIIYQKIFVDVWRNCKTTEQAFDCGEIEDFRAHLQNNLGLTFDADDEELKEAWSHIFVLNPEFPDWLRYWEQVGLKLVLASNMNKWHCEYLSKDKEFADIFKKLFDEDRCVFSFKLGERKPERVFFDDCLQRAECLPDECLFIDDLARNIAAAAKLGIHCLKYDRNRSVAENLALIGPPINPAVDRDTLATIYREKYQIYRHFDSLRWGVPVVVLTLAIVVLRAEVKQPHVIPWLMVSYGIFALLSAFLCRRLTYNQTRNNTVLRLVGRCLGDCSIPRPTHQVTPLQSAATWFEAALWIAGALSIAIGTVSLYL